MCTYFTDLNKCCPKDNIHLARIDQIIDTAVGRETMTLLDYFSGYHQIWLHEEDKEKTSFITPFGTYCYLRNVLSYVDDIVVVSKKRENYIADLAETFANMCEARLKLNPEKCVFGITKG
jgi:hypothetical protein